MTFFDAIKHAESVEDFISAVADLGDVSDGSIEDWDRDDMALHMESLICRARDFQRSFDTTACIHLNALIVAERALKPAGKDCALALEIVRHAMRGKRHPKA